jgi:hypothetical protein
METYFTYIIKATCCLSFFYIASLFLFRNNTAFKLQRLYLMTSVALALFLPLNNFSINTGKIPVPVIPIKQTVYESKVDSKPLQTFDQKVTPVTLKTTPFSTTFFRSINIIKIVVGIYWIIAGIFLIRLIYSIIYINFYFFSSKRKRIGKYTLIYSTSINGSFSFLKWIFINTEFRNNDNYREIINHEIVHAAQNHSFDTIAIELLSAVMWFNPFIWLIRRWMQQLHEYLADEGVVNSGTNVLEYQAMLVNQVAGDRLICLPSGFSQSLIKKRLAMMTKTKIKQKTGYRLIALLPLAGLILLSLSFTNKKAVSDVKPVVKTTVLTITYPTKKAKPVTEVTQFVNSEQQNLLIQDDPSKKTANSSLVAAVSPDKMNVFYLGADNPVTVAVSNISPEKVKVTIDNGTITGSKGNYIVRPNKIGKATVKVYDGNKQVGYWEFRVKAVPDPVAKVAGKKGGEISISKLLEAEKVLIDMEYFDFDIKFEATAFIISANIEGTAKEIKSTSPQITEDQKALIKQLKTGDKLIFNNIIAKGPDGRIRELYPIIFTIKE